MNAPLALFVVGCPRSGTYLLLEHLSRKAHLSVMAETHLVPTFRRWKWLYRSGKSEASRRALLNAFNSFLAIWLPVELPGSEFAIRFSAAPFIEDKSFNELIENSSDFDSLLLAVFAHFSKRGSGGVPTEKSAFFWPVHLSDQIIGATPEKVAIVNVVRDGRDTALSMSRSWMGHGYSAADASALWADHVKQKRDWLAAQKSCSYVTIRYEDFVESPEKVIERICGELQLPQVSRENKIRQTSSLAESLAKLSTHERVAAAPDASSVARYLNELSENDLFEVETMCGDQLLAEGYRLSTDAIPSARSRCRAVRRLSVTSSLRLNSLKRYFKWTLPVWLRFFPGSFIYKLVAIFSADHEDGWLEFYKAKRYSQTD